MAKIQLCRLFSILSLILLIAGCSTRNSLAPVFEPRWRFPGFHSSQHTVSRGETLYSIAFRYDQDYRQLAAINHIRPPYIVRIGQVLNLRAVPQYYVPPPTRRATPYKGTYQRATPARQVAYSQRLPISAVPRYIRWHWPADGRIAATFLPEQGRKGIDIAGRKGQKIRAASGGVVAYAGSGLTGYGNLIIIRHNDKLLTAYGNNSRNLVHEGQVVSAGQVIAEMGIVNRHYSGVHFEMRQSGIPVNPLYYLKRG